MPAKKYTPKAFKALEADLYEARVLLRSTQQQLELSEELNKNLKASYEALCASASEDHKLLSSAILPPEGYESLVQVLGDALQQAAGGKGAERHGNGLPFSAQPMQTIGFLLHSSEGMLYQVLKKVQEANTQLENARHTGLEAQIQEAKAFAEKELLGSINYLAGAIIFERAH